MWLLEENRMQTECVTLFIIVYPFYCREIFALSWINRIYHLQPELARN